MSNENNSKKVYDNWRNFLESETIDEVVTVKFSGEVADKDDPLQTWDPDSVKTTPVNTRIVKKQKVEKKSDIPWVAAGAVVAGGIFAGWTALKLLRLLKALGGRVLAFFLGKPSTKATAIAMAASPSILRVLVAFGIKAALAGAAIFAIYKLVTDHGDILQIKPAVAVDNPAGPGTEEYAADVARGLVSLNVQSWQTVDDKIRCAWCKQNPGREHIGTYSDKVSDKVKKALEDVKKNGPFCKDILKKDACKNLDVSKLSKELDKKYGTVGAVSAGQDDKDALLSMLYAETGWKRSLQEMEAIVRIAINRHIAWGMSIPIVVQPGKTNGWRSWAPGGSSYPKNFNLALKYAKRNPNSSNLGRAKEAIEKVLNGTSALGTLNGALNWLHPYGMKRCNAPHGTKMGKSYCFDYGELGLPFGKRRTPAWAIQKGSGKGQLPGGQSRTAPVAVGKMVYSNGSTAAANKVLSTTVKKNQNKIGKSNKSVVVIGDSIMATSYGAGGRLKKILEKEGSSVTNLAVGGRTLQKVGKKDDFIANQWQEAKQQGQIDVLVMNGGTNDILGMAWTSKTRKGQKSLQIFKNIATEANSMGIRILIFPILIPNKGRLSEPGPRRNGKRTRVKLADNHPRRLTKQQIKQETELWNRQLKQIADSLPNATYVSGFEGMIIEPGYKSDNVHPRAPESQKIASRLAQIIRGL
tara:strand:- start:7580 stop:9661 length:2082 start_codon:yes stop_codon:yes gene_type:complete